LNEGGKKAVKQATWGMEKEITPNTTDYVLVEITYSLQPENNIQFRSLRQFSVLLRGLRLSGRRMSITVAFFGISVDD
jgi:hypothetical protein